MQRKYFLTLFAVLVLMATSTPLSAVAQFQESIPVCLDRGDANPGDRTFLTDVQHLEVVLGDPVTLGSRVNGEVHLYAAPGRTLFQTEYDRQRLDVRAYNFFTRYAQVFALSNAPGQLNGSPYEVNSASNGWTQVVFHVQGGLPGDSRKADFEVFFDEKGNMVEAGCKIVIEPKPLYILPVDISPPVAKPTSVNPFDRSPIAVRLVASTTKHIVGLHDETGSAKNSINLFDIMLGQSSNKAPCIWDVFMSIFPGRDAGTTGGLRGSHSKACSSLSTGAPAVRNLLPGDGSGTIRP